MCDLFIKNGNVIDGSGSPAYISDIAIKNGKIERIGTSLDINCDKVIDASNQIV